MELFAKIDYGFQLLSIFAKSSILNISLGSKYVIELIIETGYNHGKKKKWNNTGISKYDYSFVSGKETGD